MKKIITLILTIAMLATLAILATIPASAGSVDYPDPIWCHYNGGDHVYIYYSGDKLWARQGSFGGLEYWGGESIPVNPDDYAGGDPCEYEMYHKDPKTGKYILCDNMTMHDYGPDGRCKAEGCPMSCGHLSWDETYRCNECGYQCTHVHYNANGVCTECKKTCTHPSYNFDYACIDCNYKCTHSDGFNKTNHRCVECGFECTHTNYNNGFCTICGSTCQEINTDHAWNNHNGICDFCGITCLEARNAEGHVWNDGICTYCEYTCLHTSEARTTCPVCGKTLSPFTQEMLDVIAKVDKVSKWYKYKESDGKYYDMMSFWKIKWGRDYTGIQSFLESYFYNITGAKLEYKADNDLYTFTVTDGTMEYAKVEALITETGYLAYFRVTTVDSTARVYMPNYTVYTLSELVELFNYQTEMSNTYWEEATNGNTVTVTEAEKNLFEIVITTPTGYTRTIVAKEQNITLNKKTMTYEITACDDFTRISAPTNFKVNQSGEIIELNTTVFGNNSTNVFVQHTHSAAGYDANYAPDCTNTGAYVYACSCGKYFSDSSCTTEIEDLTEWLATNGEKEEALGHDWSNADGICTRCEVTCEDLYACHHYTRCVCDDCGYTCEELNGPHDWSNLDGVCTNCQMTCDHADELGCECSVCGINISRMLIAELEEALSSISTTTGLTATDVQTIVTAALANYAKATDIAGVNASINALIMTVNNHADALGDLSVAMNILLNKTYLTPKDKTALEATIAAEIAKVNTTITTAINGVNTTVSTLSDTITAATEAITTNANAVEDLAARVAVLEIAVSSINDDYLTSSDKAAIETKISADIAAAMKAFVEGDFKIAVEKIEAGAEAIKNIAEDLTKLQATVKAISADYLTSADKIALETKITTEITASMKAFAEGDFTTAVNRITANEEAIKNLNAELVKLQAAVEVIGADYLTAADKVALEEKISAEITAAVSQLVTTADFNTAVSAVNNSLADIFNTLTAFEARIEALEKADIDEAAVNVLITNVVAGYVTNEDYNSTMATLNKAVADIDAIMVSVNAINATVNALPTTYVTNEQVNILIANAIAAYDAQNGTAALSNGIIEAIDNVAKEIGKIGELFDRMAALESAGFITEAQVQEIVAPVANGYSSEYDLLADKNFQTLEATVQYLQEVISNFNLTSIENRINSLETEVASLKAENAAQKKAIDEAKKSDAALAEAIEAMRAELEAMKNVPASEAPAEEEVDITELTVGEAIVIGMIIILVVTIVAVVVTGKKKN